MEDQLIIWDCPKCGEKNKDISDQGTHCAACGLVVWVGKDETQIFNEDWCVPVMKGLPPADDWYFNPDKHA